LKRAALTVTLGIAIRSRVSIFQSLQILAPCLLLTITALTYLQMDRFILLTLEGTTLHSMVVTSQGHTL